jgi:hypothetical protein
VADCHQIFQKRMAYATNASIPRHDDTFALEALHTSGSDLPRRVAPGFAWGDEHRLSRVVTLGFWKKAFLP